MRSLVLAGLLVVVFQATAQKDSIPFNSVRYFNQLTSGVLMGKKGYGTTATLSLVNGIRINRWAIGLGVGYDDYFRVDLSDPFGANNYVRWRVMPLFASVSGDLFNIRNNSVFFQLRTGYSMTWAANREEVRIVENSRGGGMLNPSVGYRVATGKYSIYVGAGYKVQRNRYQYNAYPGILGFPSSQVSVKETMQRFEIHIGVGMN